MLEQTRARLDFLFLTLRRRYNRECTADPICRHATNLRTTRAASICQAEPTMSSKFKKNWNGFIHKWPSGSIMIFRSGGLPSPGRHSTYKNWVRQFLFFGFSVNKTFDTRYRFRSVCIVGIHIRSLFYIESFLAKAYLCSRICVSTVRTSSLLAFGAR